MAYNFDAAIKSGVTPQEITNYLSSQGRLSEANSYFGQVVQPKQPNYFQRVWNQYKQSATNIIDDVKMAGDKKMNPLSVGLQTVGEVAKSAFTPIVEAPIIKPALEAVGKTVAKVPLVQEAATKYEEWKIQHPEAAGNLEASVNIAGLLLANKGSVKAEQATKQATIKVTEKASKGITKLGQGSKALGEKSYGLAVGMEEPTKIALQSYQASQPSLIKRVGNFLTGKEAKKSLDKPIIEANTAARKGLAGTEWQLGVQAKKVSNDLWNKTISPALKNTKDKVSVPKFLQELKKDIIKTSDLNRRKTLLDAFESFADDYKKVGNVSFEKLQTYKEGWAKFVPEASYKGKPIGGSLNEIRNLAAQKARQTIYKQLGGEVKQAYLDYGNLQSIMTAGRKSVDLLRSKGITKQVWEAIIDKAVSPVATYGGQILYRTGEGLEFLGKKGAKKVKDIIK